MTASAPISPPRIVLELAPDGTIVVEQYLNGSRRREALHGDILHEIMLCLAEQKAEQNRQAARKAEKAALADASLHRKVYFETAYRHGVEFAERTVNGKSAFGQGKSPFVPRQGDGLVVVGGVETSTDLL